MRKFPFHCRVDADARIQAIGGFTAEQLRLVLKIPALQISVRSVAAARLRRLECEQRASLQEAGR